MSSYYITARRSSAAPTHLYLSRLIESLRNAPPNTRSTLSLSANRHGSLGSRSPPERDSRVTLFLRGLLSMDSDDDDTHDPDYHPGDADGDDGSFGGEKAYGISPSF